MALFNETYLGEPVKKRKTITEQMPKRSISPLVESISDWVYKYTRPGSWAPTSVPEKIIKTQPVAGDINPYTREELIPFSEKTIEDEDDLIKGYKQFEVPMSSPDVTPPLIASPTRTVPTPPITTKGVEGELEIPEITDTTKGVVTETGIKTEEELSPEDRLRAKLKGEAGTIDSKYDKYYDEYTANLKRAGQRADIADAGMALWNLSALNRAGRDYETEDYRGYDVTAPQFQYPGGALRKAGEAQIDKSIATRNKIMREMGKPEYITTGDEIEARQKMEAGIIGQQYDVINKNIAAQAEAETKTKAIEADVFNKNIQKQIQENMMRGQTITQAMGALSEQARQYINRLTATERNKLLAKIQLETAKESEIGSLWSRTGL